MWRMIIKNKSEIEQCVIMWRVNQQGVIAEMACTQQQYTLSSYS